jgi:hypothetical protein
MAIISALTLLDDLKQLGLCDPLFREKLHHLRDSITGFRAFAARVGFFHPYGCNQLLYDRLEYIRTRCQNGEIRGGVTMEDLVAEAKRAVPCKGYRTCKKHASDPACSKLI